MATYADLESANLYALEGPPRPPRPRKVPAYAIVREMLLNVLVDLRLEGRRSPPKLEGMLAELRLRHRRGKGVPRRHTTLSYWINASRHEAGLDGGYRATIAELWPEARRLARNQVRKVSRTNFS